jgi:hypothetical protein
VLATWDLTRPELELLGEVCRTFDEIEELRLIIERDGLTVAGSKGQTVSHPGLAQIRASRALAARLLAQIDLPSETGETLPTALQVRGRRAAAARWRQRDAQRQARQEWTRGQPA